jgi:hypothetical protein
VRNRTILIVLGLSLLLSLSPVSAATVIQHGVDVFTTPDDGRTFYDFSYNPIPAGFFCKGSKAFTGKVAFKGLPLVTDPPGQILGADTVVERLDDAAFDDRGIATTRIRFRALSLVSSSPIQTACGAFHVYVSLRGRQRVTTMSIFRTQEGGGDFTAPLAVDARLTFIPVKPPRNKGGRQLELTQSIAFPATPSPWSLKESVSAQRAAPIAVDTNGDLIPDALLPGASNFAAGQSPGRSMLKLTPKYCSCCPGETVCHSNSGQEHCTVTTMCPGTESCC